MHPVVFCQTVKNRTPHLKMTLPRNLADNPKSKFVILNYNTDDDLLEYLFAEHGAEIESGRLVVYSELSEPKFRMAHAKNMAHRLGILEGGEILVNLDADNITGPHFEHYAANRFARWENPEPRNIFLWTNVVSGLHSSGVRITRGLSGRIVVSRKAFLKCGGYDEKFNEWAPDDKDFNLRLRLLGYEPVEIDLPYLLGVPHNEKMRFKEYPHLRDADLTEYFLDVNEMTVERAVVNSGNFGCGVVYRNRDMTKRIRLGPLPTKIFGIGMHKTATTSLHHALQALGYDSWHWSGAHQAKAIWREMNNEGYSRTLDRYHAASDLPIPRLYRQLDAAYPGSKFILTMRGDDAWIDAVKRHFDPSLNPMRAGWNNDPFTNRIHTIMYGRPDFDAETFLARYRRHNDEVREHFRHRPDDLLVMHMEDGGARWPELCGFLGVPIPEGMDYPRANGGK
jgi:hypothetical protein